MTTRKTALILTILVLTFGAIWVGCSDNQEFVTKYDPNNTNGGESISSEVTYYFPLYEGYKTVYRVTEGSTEYPESFTVGRVVYKTTGNYLPWISYSPHAFGSFLATGCELPSELPQYQPILSSLASWSHFEAEISPFANAE